MPLRIAVPVFLLIILASVGLTARIALAPQAQASATQTIEEFRAGALPATAEDVVAPVLRSQVAPKYTSTALRLKLQGVVELEAVVGTDGRVDRVRLTRSLDSEYGLDESALEAARQWRFEPASHAGEPVPVYLTLTLQFRMH